MTTATASQNLSKLAQRDELIVEHMNLVGMIASHIQRSIPVHVELDDLTHAGMMGLLEAADKFEAGKDVSFPTYAKHRIRGAILDSLRRADHVSRDLRKRYKQVEAVRQVLSSKLMREPNEQELADALGVSEARWREMSLEFQQITALALHTSTDHDDQRPVMEVPASKDECPELQLARREMKSKLNNLLNTLPVRHSQVLVSYYEKGLTMKEIADQMGVRESRISQIHRSALNLLNRQFAATGVTQYAAIAA